MKYFIIIIILVINYTDFFAQKSDKSLYFKTNFEYRRKDTKGGFFNGNENYIKFLRNDLVVGIRFDKSNSAVKLGILAYSWSKSTNKSSSDIHTSKQVINSKSLGIESIYMFKLNKYPTRALGVVIGINVAFSYQYVFSKRHLLSRFSYQNDIEKNENYEDSVFGTGLGLVLLKKINDKIAIDLSIENRFYLPTTNNISYVYSGNHYLTTFSINYIIN